MPSPLAFVKCSSTYFATDRFHLIYPPYVRYSLPHIFIYYQQFLCNVRTTHASMHCSMYIVHTCTRRHTIETHVYIQGYQPSTLSSWSHWPRGPVDLKSHWPPPKIHWPPIFSNDVSPSKTAVDIKTLK